MAHKSIETDIRVNVKGVDEAIDSLNKGEESIVRFKEGFDAVEDSVDKVNRLVDAVEDLKKAFSEKLKINIDMEDLNEILASEALGSTIAKTLLTKGADPESQGAADILIWENFKVGNARDAINDMSLSDISRVVEMMLRNRETATPPAPEPAPEPQPAPEPEQAEIKVESATFNFDEVEFAGFTGFDDDAVGFGDIGAVKDEFVEDVVRLEETSQPEVAKPTFSFVNESEDMGIFSEYKPPEPQEDEFAGWGLGDMPDLPGFGMDEAIQDLSSSTADLLGMLNEEQEAPVDFGDFNLEGVDFGLPEQEEPTEPVADDQPVTIENMTVTANEVEVDGDTVSVDGEELVTMAEAEQSITSEQQTVVDETGVMLDELYAGGLDSMLEKLGGASNEYVTRIIQALWDDLDLQEDESVKMRLKAEVAGAILGDMSDSSRFKAVRDGIDEATGDEMVNILVAANTPRMLSAGANERQIGAFATQLTDMLTGTPSERRGTNTDGTLRANHDTTRFSNFGVEFNDLDNEEMNELARQRASALRKIKSGKYNIQKYVKSDNDTRGILNFLENADRLLEDASDARSKFNAEIRDADGNITQEGSAEWHRLNAFIQQMESKKAQYAAIRARLTEDGTADGVIDPARLQQARVHANRQAVALERLPSYDIAIDERRYTSQQDLYSALSRRATNLQQDIGAFDDGSPERERLNAVLRATTARMEELAPLIERSRELQDDLNRQAFERMTTLTDQRLGQSNDSYLRQLLSQQHELNTRGRRLASSESDGDLLDIISATLQDEINLTQERVRADRETDIDNMTQVRERGIIQSQRSYASSLEAQHRQLQTLLRTAHEGTEEHRRITEAMDDVNDELARTQQRIANQDTIRQMAQRGESMFTTMNQAFELGERLWSYASRGLDFVDQYSMSNARLNYINDESAPGAMGDIELQRYISDMSSRTRTKYAETADMVSRFQMSQGFDSTEEAAKFTETVMKSFRIAGSNESEASDATRQLTQAFSKGKLDGDEFRSVAENAPLIINAIADLLGTDKGGVMNASKSGELTIDILKQAIENIAGEVDSAFADIPVTFSDMKVKVENELGQFMTTTDEGIELTQTVFGIVEEFVEYLTSEEGVETLTALAELAGGVATLGAGILDVSEPIISFLAQTPSLLLGVVGGFQALKFIARNPLDEMLDNLTSAFDLIRSSAGAVRNAWNGVDATLQAHGTSIAGLGLALGGLAIGIQVASKIIAKMKEEREEDAHFEDSLAYGGKNRFMLKDEGYTYDEAMQLEELYLERNRLETGLRYFEAGQATGQEQIDLYDNIESVYGYSDVKNVRDARAKALELENLQEEIANLSYMDKDKLDEIAENTAKTAENTSESGFLKEFRSAQAQATHVQTINQSIPSIIINVPEGTSKSPKEYARELAQELREQAMLGAVI